MDSSIIGTLHNIPIAVDFDGTCVTHAYPKIGRFIGAEGVLADLVKEGARLILWTMRSGAELEEAVAWFQARGIPLYGVNSNPDQAEWTTSPKVYAKWYIDDAGIGVPLCQGLIGERPYVDWDQIRARLLPHTVEAQIPIEPSRDGSSVG